jgi:hypothetical protein
LLELGVVINSTTISLVETLFIVQKKVRVATNALTRK